MNQPKNSLSRRNLFAGATALGAMAATVSLIPSTPESVASADQPKQAPVAGGGYSLSEHVKRYYKTTRV